MAYTVTKYPTVFGNKRTIGLEITADAATQTVETGLSVIEFFSVGISSATTMASMHIKKNLNASGVAANGSLGMSGFTSGDLVFVTVYGR